MARTPVFAALLLLGTVVFADISRPKVDVYTTRPLEIGKPNTLVCYVSMFHPPDIQIELLNGDQPVPNVKAEDMSFQMDWTFYQMVHANFTCTGDEVMGCRVTHFGGEPKFYKWEPMR